MPPEKDEHSSASPAHSGGGAGTLESGPVLQAVRIEKSFGSTRALRGVDLSIHAGRTTALVGRNGAGKSTLINILSGLSTPDAGQVLFGDEPAPPLRDLESWRSRIATVHQHSMIVPELSVAENMFLGRSERLVNWRSLRAQSATILEEWGFPISPDTRCGDLTVEQRQIVEIARALATGSKCLLLDEPTAALERGAIQRLFELVQQLTAGGVAVLYISHHLEEVFEVCQDVTILRDGEVVLQSEVADLTQAAMVKAMVGNLGAAPAVNAPALVGVAKERGEAAADTGAGLKVEDLHVSSARGALQGVSLQVAPGERVGVTGLLSAGVATLGRAVAGMERIESGRLLLDGRPVRTGRRDTVQRAGIGYIPEDRRAEGFVAHLSIAENAAMTVAERLTGRLGIGTARRRADAVRPLTDALFLVCSGLDQPVGELSGGNQQKVTVARTLIHDPSVIVAITPTRGVDVASKQLLLTALADTARERQAGLLLCSDEFDDLIDYCDRIVVLVRGEVFTEFGAPPFEHERLLAASEGMTNPEQKA